MLYFAGESAAIEFHLEIFLLLPLAERRKFKTEDNLVGGVRSSCLLAGSHY